MKLTKKQRAMISAITSGMVLAEMCRRNSRLQSMTISALGNSASQGLKELAELGRIMNGEIVPPKCNAADPAELFCPLRGINDEPVCNRNCAIPR